jgi:D-alanyl-D-alanine carboxypeptidase
MAKRRVQGAAALMGLLTLIAPAAATPSKPALSSATAAITHTGVASAAASPSGKSKLQEIVRGLVARGAPGALAVVRTPAGIHRAANGLARRQPRLRMEPSDRFRVASVTKTFVATRVLQLAAEGRLSLDDSVGRWLPGLVPRGNSITLRQLLNHTSGLLNYVHDKGWANAMVANPRRRWTPRELVAIGTSNPPLFTAGKGWLYSNTNYILLGLVVEAATGKTLARDLQDRLFRPLGLRSTSFPPGTAITGRFAHGYVGSGLRWPIFPVRAGILVDISSRMSPSWLWAAGQMVSNAADVTRFFAVLMQGRLLPAALLVQMTTPVASYSYGLGVVIERTPCGVAVGQKAEFPGYRTIVWATGNGSRVAAVMVNIDTTRLSWATLEEAAQTALCSG